MKNNIKLCVFDVDGTLVDTREFIVSAFEYTLVKHGLPAVSREYILKNIGKPLAVDYRAVTGLTDVDEFCATHRAFQNKNQHLVELFPSVLETLQALKDKGIKLVAATTRSRITSIASLEQVGLNKYFDLIISFEDVKKPKPDPEGIIKSMEQFSIKPLETFMVGDRDTDIQAGKNAGVKTIAVNYGSEENTISKSSPDYLISGIIEILDLV